MARLWTILLLLISLQCAAQTCSPACSAKATCFREECICDEGYEALAGAAALTCLDIDECATGTAGCDADYGYCVDYDPPLKFDCGCLPGYMCQNPPACTKCIIDTEHPCNINNGDCTESEVCIPLANNGTTCSPAPAEEEEEEEEEEDPDDPNPTNPPVAGCATADEAGALICDPISSTCEMVSESPTCVCNSGFVKYGASCRDIDECLSLTTNNCAVGRSVCVNLPGNFRCQCKTNFTDFPGSIRGTDCRTQAEIDYALEVGSTYVVGTGLSGISPEALSPGSVASIALIDFFANKFNISAAAVSISNVTTTTSSRRLGSRELQVDATTFFLNFAITSGIMLGFGSSGFTITINEEALVQAINDKVDEINDFFESVMATDINGDSFEIDEASVDDYIDEVVTTLEDANVVLDESAMMDTDVVGLTYVADLTSLSDVSAQELVDSGVDNEIVQQLQRDGFSGTPTAAPSGTSRLLGAEEEEDFFGDFAASACKCVDCDPLSGCEDVWRGRDVMVEGTMPQTRTHVVVDHCADDLGWIPAFLNDVQVESITIVSRCGKTVDSPFADADILSFDNIAGSNDVFLSWILEQYDESMTGTVLFLQDHSPMMTNGAQLVSAAERTSFACSASASALPDEPNAKSKSAYCRTSSLKKGFWDKIGLGFEEELVRVCDSMTFAANWESIYKKEKSMWESLANHASHMTKEWGALLAQPLVGEDLDSVLEYSNEEVDGCLYHKTPKAEEEQQQQEEEEEEEEEDSSSLATTSRFGISILKSLVRW